MISSVVSQLCDCATKRRTDHGLNALPLTVVTPFGTLTCLMIFFSPLFPTCTPAPLLMVMTAPSMMLQYSVLLLEATLSTFSGPDPTFLQDTSNVGDRVGMRGRRPVSNDLRLAQDTVQTSTNQVTLERSDGGSTRIRIMPRSSLLPRHRC